MSAHRDLSPVEFRRQLVLLGVPPKVAADLEVMCSEVGALRRETVEAAAEKAFAYWRETARRAA